VFLDRKNVKKRVQAGVNPGFGGTQYKGINVYDTVEEAIYHTRLKSIISILPPMYAPHALLEAIDSGADSIICLSDFITQNDMIKVNQSARVSQTCLFGPHPLGLVVPGAYNMSLFDDLIFVSGSSGILSLASYQTTKYVIENLTNCGIGQGVCIGISPNNVYGYNLTVSLKEMLRDPNIKNIIIISDEPINFGSIFEELDNTNNIKPLHILMNKFLYELMSKQVWGSGYKAYQDSSFLEYKSVKVFFSVSDLKNSIHETIC
jgi:succinyl-CoA synthetase alpha subunit